MLTDAQKAKIPEAATHYNNIVGISWQSYENGGGPPIQGEAQYDETLIRAAREFGFANESGEVPPEILEAIDTEAAEQYGRSLGLKKAS